MSTNYSPKIITNNLLVCIDPSNTKSYQYKNNIIEPKYWTIGTGSTTGFTQNGIGSQNVREYLTDPWGNNQIIWQAYSSGTNTANGGWVTATYPIDRTKMYRFSVWTNRYVQGVGNFYLGTYAYDVNSTNVGAIYRTTGVNSANFYFWVSASPPNSQLPTDAWNLVVSHFWPSGSGTGSNHNDSGIYNNVGTKIGNISYDAVFESGSTKVQHRSYLYYSTDNTTRQRWLEPRVDLIDGTEPSIDNLISNKQNTLVDISNHNYNGTMINTPMYSSSYNGVLYFDGRNDYIQLPNLGSFTDFTICSWILALGDSIEGPTGYNTIIGIAGSNRLLYSTDGHLLAQMGAGNHNSTANIAPRGKWNYIVYRYDSSTTTAQWCVNGIPDTTLVGSASFLQPASIGWYGATAYMMNGYMSLFKIYNKYLTDVEIMQNFNASRNRFGV